MQIGNDNIEIIERTVFENETIFRQEIQLDGKHFNKVKFKECTLVYSGSDELVFQDNIVDKCQWKLSGPAGNALTLMMAIYGSTPDLTDNVIVNTFKFPIPLRHRIYGFFYKHFRKSPI